jgi:hypothetical protein
MSVRKTLPHDEVTTEHDEDARWLTVDRGPFRLACNFSDQAQYVPTGGRCELVLATRDDDAELRGDSVRLQPLSGALLR